MKYTLFLKIAFILLAFQYNLSADSLSTNNNEPLLNISKSEIIKFEKINLNVFIPKNANQYLRWELHTIGSDNFGDKGTIEKGENIIRIDLQLKKTGNHLIILDLFENNGNVKTILGNVNVKPFWKSNLILLITLPVIISILINLLFSRFMLYFSLREQIIGTSKSLYQSINEEPNNPVDFSIPINIDTMFNLYAPVNRYKKLKKKADILNRSLLEYKTKNYERAKDQLKKIYTLKNI